jgi:hypothetical protein
MINIHEPDHVLYSENDRKLKVFAGEWETGRLTVSGTGELVIVNTGGSSASEGGMGSGSPDDTEKGSLSKPGEKSGEASSNEEEDITFDPLKKNIKEAEKKSDKD